MFVSALLTAALACAAPTSDDVLVVDVDAHEVRLPESLRVTLSGALRFEIDDEGRTLVRLPADARVLVDGADVGGRIELRAGDSAVVLSSDGPLSISVAAPAEGDVPGPFARRVDIPGVFGEGPRLARIPGDAAQGDGPDAFRHALSVGGGSGGLFGVGRDGPPAAVLGLTTAPPGEALAAQLNLDADATQLVVQAPDDLPAARAGLRPHDVIVAVDGERPVTLASLRKAIAARQPGDVLTLTVLRGGMTIDLPVTLGARTSEVRGALMADAFARLGDEEGLAGLLEQQAMRAELEQSLDRISAGLAERRAVIDQLSAQLAVEQATRAQVGARRAELEARLATLPRGGDEASDEHRRALEQALDGEAARQQELLERLERTATALTDARDELAARNQELAARKLALGEASTALDGWAKQLSDRAREMAIVGQEDGQRALVLSREAAEEAARAYGERMRRSAEEWAAVQGRDAAEAARRAAAEAELAARDAGRQALEERLATMEERLARIEALLETLAASKPH